MRIPSNLKPAALALGLWLASGGAAGMDVYWTQAPACVGVDIGTATGCWSTVPDQASTVYLQTLSPDIYTYQLLNGSVQAGRMALSGGQAPVRLRMSGGTLNVGENLYLSSGPLGGVLGSAEFIQSAGNVSAGGLTVGTDFTQSATSLYDVRGGSVTAALAKVGFTYLTVGVGVTLETLEVQSPGILRVDGAGFADFAELRVSSLGTLDIRGGELRTPRLMMSKTDTARFSGGLLQITGAGSVWSNGTFAYGNPIDPNVGATLRLATGATLDIQGSQVAGEPGLVVGLVGLGILQLEAGARLSTGDAVVARGFFLAPGEGHVLVDGPGAMWSSSGTLDIGVWGKADLQVLRGGTVISQHAYMGRTVEALPTLAHNTALIRGAGSRWRMEQTLTIGGSSTAAVQGSDVTVTEGGRLEVGGQLLVWGGSNLQLGNVGSATAGTLVATAGSVVTLQGARLQTTGGTQVAGALRFLNGDTSNIDGAVTLSSTGRLEVGSTEARISGLLATAPGSVVELRGGTLAVDGGAQVQGRLNVLSGTDSVIDGAVTLGPTGRLDVGASTLTLRGPVTFEPSTQPFQAGAQVHNAGEIHFLDRTVFIPGVLLTGNGAKYFHGSVVVDSPIATIMDSNALALMPGSVLELALGAQSRGVRLFSQSWVSLAGGLKLRSSQGYGGQAGDRFAVIGASAGLEGGFTAVDTSGFALAPGLRWDFSQLNTAGIVGIAAAVPEPHAWALMLAGLAAVGACAQRRRPAPV